ncbi:MAG TPA: hypothetical protein PKW35_11415 [Nannocystaceae bacterium]|nr:hypothetical protein [Nannocystaceae bacterium]
MTRSDDPVVRAAIHDNLLVHPRIVQQGGGPGPEQRAALAAALPQLVPFANNRYIAARAILDWDHQLPSAFAVLRLLLCYSDREARSLDAEIGRREREIAADNLYPEFDLPDYGPLTASETYVTMVRGGQVMGDDIRFTSEWRRRVDQSAQRNALAAIRRLDTFQRSMQGRTSEHLGPPVVIGWTPPCLARSTKWAVEVWLLTDFDGHRGRAHVFMVDSGNHSVTREFFTDVMLG